jgi:hypothetical protein
LQAVGEFGGAGESAGAGAGVEFEFPRRRAAGRTGSRGGVALATQGIDELVGVAFEAALKLLRRGAAVLRGDKRE